MNDFKELLAKQAEKIGRLTDAVLSTLTGRGYIELPGAERTDRIYTVHRNMQATDPEHPWRVTYFDNNGPIGHYVFKTAEEALKDLVHDVIPLDVTGTLDRWAVTDQWSEGLDTLILIERENAQRFASSRKVSGR